MIRFLSFQTKSFFRRFFAPAMVLVLGILASCSDGEEQTTEPNIPKVAILQYADSPLHNYAVEGILLALEEKGFKPGETLAVANYNALRQPANLPIISGEILNAGFDLVITTGTQPLQAFAAANEGGGVIHVFGVVANPSNAGVGIFSDDPMGHPPHLVGIGSFPPVEPVFELAKEINPGLKTIGVVWNPAEVNSEEGMEKARFIAGELGIDLLEATAGTYEAVGAAARSLVEKGAEALWIGPDNTVHHSADAVIAAAADGGIPVISSMPGDAARGALVDLTHNWQEVGQAIGSMAADILNGADPSSLAIVTHPDDFRLFLNPGTLEGLNPPWALPKDVIGRAEGMINDEGEAD
jgi:putative ABC transport system substrate-binding protein